MGISELRPDIYIDYRFTNDNAIACAPALIRTKMNIDDQDVKDYYL
jgi:hypothetical protein